MSCIIISCSIEGQAFISICRIPISRCIGIQSLIPMSCIIISCGIVPQASTTIGSIITPRSIIRQCIGTTCSITLSGSVGTQGMVPVCGI